MTRPRVSCAALPASLAPGSVPDEMVELCRLGLAGDFPKALELQARMFPLFQSMVAEVNPVPVKVGMELLGLCPANLRLPLTRATDGTEGMVREGLTKLGKL